MQRKIKPIPVDRTYKPMLTRYVAPIVRERLRKHAEKHNIEIAQSLEIATRSLK